MSQNQQRRRCVTPPRGSSLMTGVLTTIPQNENENRSTPTRGNLSMLAKSKEHMIAVQVAIKYHALATSCKTAAKLKFEQADDAYQTARRHLTHVCKTTNQEVERARKVKAVAESVHLNAFREEHEARHYLKSTGGTKFIAAKYHATASTKLNGACTTREEARKAFEEARDDMERILREAQGEFHTCKAAKEEANDELNRAWEEVMVSRSFLRQLGV